MAKIIFKIIQSKIANLCAKYIALFIIKTFASKY